MCCPEFAARAVGNGIVAAEEERYHLKNLFVMFDAPLKVSLAERDDQFELADGELLVRKLYSLISTGTELACLSGGESWFKMPSIPGYCCVSQVEETQSDAFAKGDMIFHYGSHSLYQKIGASDFIVRVPQGIDPIDVPAVRMATIAFTAVRISQIELGDFVAVTGLGMVGNMAAQLATLSGATVIGIDPSPKRREEALSVGIAYAVDPAEAPEKIRQITDGQGVGTAIEATGIPKVAHDIFSSIGYHGEIIFLGTPRGAYETNLADVLRYSHIDGQGSITFKGAHEWRYPVRKDKFVKHSIERNTQVCLDLMRQGKLRVRELISDVIAPNEAPETYLKLNADRNAYMGIIIDWTKG